MRRFTKFLIVFAFAVIAFIGTHNANAGYWEKHSTAQAKPKEQGPGPAKKDNEKPFNEVIKGFDKIPGLFDFYVNKKDGSVFMAVKPDQLNRIFLCGMTRSAGDGSYFDSGAQTGDFPFEIKQVGKKIQFLQVNTRFHADSTSAMSRAMGRSISYSIFGSTTVASLPDDKGSILIDPSGILVTDVGNIGYFLGNEGKTGFRFDKENSNFGTIKSFPLNSEIDVVLHYKTDKPNPVPALDNPYSMLLTYHYSFSTLPETDYKPRLADDRVGYFNTIYQDYTHIDAEEPYVRYIDRWKLEKKDPTAALSEPKEPIVFWVENTTPEEYRDDVMKGVLFWNKAFEKAGFKNAMVCKIMPDTADWDPADVRFNTIRWFVSPGAGYAVGPHRSNPFTGQIYDADVRISADFVRYMFSYAESFLEPISMGKQNPIPHNPGDYLDIDWRNICDYGEQSSRLAAEGLAVLDVTTPFDVLPALSQKYIHEYIQELVSHEVGHTLGLRHNFKASTAWSRDQQTDPDFTAKNGVVGTVMEYAPPNLSPEGKPQADFYTVTPGPYDMWAIEYGYKPIDAANPWAEKKELDKIASRASEPQLAYGTDEDCYGNSARAVDPYATQFDLGSDPLEYWKMRVALSKKLWANLETKFEKPGQNYKKLRNVFAFGWGTFSAGGANVARFIGGISNHRDHIGDPNGRLPFEPVPAAKQREAMKFIVDNVWSGNAFQFSSNFLNKLQPERLEDFNGVPFTLQRIDYPLHSQVLAVQSAPLHMILNPATLNRISDIEEHYAKGTDVYSMTEVFSDVRKAIWSEAVAGQNVSATRRNLQREHLDILVDMVTNTTSPYPDDARTLARVDLRALKSALSNDINSATLNTISKGHYEDALARINAALDASINLKM